MLIIVIYLKCNSYFDMQGEIFTPYTIAIGDFANVKTQVLDRTLPDFDENMVELMALVSDQEDPQWEEIKSQYLQIPKKMPDRVKIMAENIVLNADNDYEKAVLLEQWLKNNCTYTKTPGDIPEGEEAVSWFLKTRQGYCTYYASAMTMMAREIGLPARYVTGFALGWVEGYDNAYYATESTAHAWCEIYFKGIGWVTFDPSGWDFSYNAETGEEFPDIEERDSSVDEEENGEFEPDPDATYDVFIDPFEEETPEEEIRHFFLPYFIIVGILAILFLIVWIRKLLLDYFLKKYELRRILKGRNHEQVMDEYYYDFLVQMRILDHPIQRGETTHHFFERMLPEMEWIRKEFIWFGELVDEVHFAGRKPSMQELERVFFFHSDVERKMLNQMKPRNYLVKRFFTKGSFS